MSVPQSVEGFKICPNCKSLLTIEEFPISVRRGTVIFRRSICKTCYNDRAKQGQRNYRARHPERQRASDAKYYQSHKTEFKERNHKYRVQNRDELLQYDRLRNTEDRKRQKREAMAAAYQADPAKFRERNKRYWLTVKGSEEQTSRQRSLYAAAQPSRRAYQQRYYSENYDLTHEWGREAARRRRARKQDSPRIERIDRQAIIERDNATCYLWCKRVLEVSDIALDHVVPLARGGTHAADNLRVACKPCNAKKHTKLLSELGLTS